MKPNVKKKDNKPVKELKSTINPDEFFSDHAMYSNDSDYDIDEIAKSNVLNAEGYLSEHLIKYETFKPIIEKLIPEDINKIDNILNRIYKMLIDFYDFQQQQDEEENYLDFSYTFFDLTEEINELNITSKSCEETVKLIYVLSYMVSRKIIEIKKDRFYDFYTTMNTQKAKIYTDLSSEYEILMKKLTGNSNMETAKKLINDSGIESNSSNKDNSISNFRKIFMYPLKDYHIQNQEYTFINKIPKKSCIPFLEDLFDLYDFMSRYFELVCSNFQSLIINYNIIISEERDLNKVFLAEFASSIIEDPFLKVRLNI